MDSTFSTWLLLAGPLWAAIGLVALPRSQAKRKRDQELSVSSLQIAGVISGFALGPIGVGLFYLQPQLIRRATLVLGILIAVFVSSQVLVRVSDPNLPSVMWLLLAGPCGPRSPVILSPGIIIMLTPMIKTP